MRTSGSRLQSRSSEPDTSLGERIAAPILSEDDRSHLTDILAKTESNLMDNVLPFWTRNTWDEEYGGFITHLDRKGNRTGVCDKYLVMQGRIIWSLSAAHRFGLRDKGYLELARKGVSFLMEKMWDGRHGGFFWAVKRNGKPKDSRKKTVGHAFAIYALAEYVLATQDTTVLPFAEDTFLLIHQKAADVEFGFLEDFTRDWKLDTGSWRHPRIWLDGEAGTYKRLDTHLHIMEALTLLTQAANKPGPTLALRRTMDLLLTRAVHPTEGYAFEYFHRDWLPRLGKRISYGHNVELAWLLLDTGDTLHVPFEAMRSQVLGLVDHALDFGFDAQRGGLASYGQLTRKDENPEPTSWLVRVWWVQAEMLVALIEIFRRTGEHKYLEAFEKQFSWIWRFQIDHEYGDWYAQTDWHTGRPLIFDKGNEWKTLYHNSRALIRVARNLRALLA